MSHTTRQQSAEESHGRDYYFIDDSTFTRAAMSVSLHKYTLHSIIICKVLDFMVLHKYRESLSKSAVKVKACMD